MFKKLLIAVMMLVTVTASHARTTKADIDALNNYNVIDEIQQVQRNRQAAPVFNYPAFECSFTTTNEKTGRITKYQTYTVAGDTTKFTDTEKQYVYYEEDETGSSIAYVDKKMLSATMTVQDASGTVITTGHATGCIKL